MDRRSPPIAASPQFKAVLEYVDRIRSFDRASVTVLICGETGSGKEEVARALHGDDPQPFVAVNCGAIPGSVLASELFGHARGAFTGAFNARKGAFARVGRGTLFLDEVGELPLDLQPILLRAVQERVFQPLGDDREHPFHGRLVFATNRDLARQIEAGAFRQDLFYRINQASILIPPLRERREDIVPLAERFLESMGGGAKRALGASARARLEAYSWPGNIRELENMIKRAVLASPAEVIEGDDLVFPDLVGRSSAVSGRGRRSRRPRPDLSYDQWERLFEDHAGNKTHMAKALGVARPTLYELIEGSTNAQRAQGKYEKARGRAGREPAQTPERLVAQLAWLREGDPVVAPLRDAFRSIEEGPWDAAVATACRAAAPLEGADAHPRARAAVAMLDRLRDPPSLLPEHDLRALARLLLELAVRDRFRAELAADPPELDVLESVLGEVSKDGVLAAIEIDHALRPSDPYDPSLVLRWVARNPWLHTLVRERRSGTVLAYANVMPVTDAAYEAIRARGWSAIDYLAEDIESWLDTYGAPSPKKLYILSVAARPDYPMSHAPLRATLERVLQRKLRLLRERGFEVTHLITDAVTRDGRELAQACGLKYQGPIGHESHIFEDVLAGRPTPDTTGGPGSPTKVPAAGPVDM